MVRAQVAAPTTATVQAAPTAAVARKAHHLAAAVPAAVPVVVRKETPIGTTAVRRAASAIRARTATCVLAAVSAIRDPAPQAAVPAIWTGAAAVRVQSHLPAAARAPLVLWVTATRTPWAALHAPSAAVRALPSEAAGAAAVAARARQVVAVEIFSDRQS